MVNKARQVGSGYKKWIHDFAKAVSERSEWKLFQKAQAIFRAIWHWVMWPSLKILLVNNVMKKMTKTWRALQVNVFTDDNSGSDKDKTHDYIWFPTKVGLRYFKDCCNIIFFQLTVCWTKINFTQGLPYARRKWTHCRGLLNEGVISTQYE